LSYISSQKDAYWFSHDAGASHDPDIVRLRRKWGIAGYGAFFFIIERLREKSPTYKIELRCVEDIAYDGQFDVAIIDECFDIDLLQRDDEYFWSDTLIERMEHYDKIKKKRAVAGAKGGVAKAKKKAKSSKSKANAKQLSGKCVAKSSQDRIGEDRINNNQTSPGEITSLKDEIDIKPDNEIEVQDGQVEKTKMKIKVSKIIIPLMQELWPTLDQVGAETYYMKIRSVHGDLSAEKLEKIIRIAWAKWPNERTIWESGGLGSWILREIGIYLRDEKHEAEHDAFIAAREAERRGEGPMKADIHVRLGKIKDNLDQWVNQRKTVILYMDRVQGVINEAVEDGIELPEIIVSWLNRGRKSKAFEFGNGLKLTGWHLASGTPGELIKAPPAPMNQEEIAEQIAKAKEQLGMTSNQEAPESPTTAGSVDTPEAPGELDPEDLAVLEAARIRIRQQPAQPARSSEVIGDLIGGAVGSTKKGDNR